MGKTIRQLRCQAAALLAQSDLWNDAVPQSVRTLIQDLSAEEEQEIDFKRIVDAIDESIFITDKDGYVLYVNPSYSRNTDVPESDVLHRYVWDIIADGVFSGGATIPVLQSKKKVYRLSTTFRSDPPRMGYTAGVPIFDENGELEQVVVSSRPIRSLMQLRGEYPQFLSRARSYVENETQILQEAVPAREGSLQWNSPSMEQVHKLICRAAPTDATILLTGESGVGKEVVADEIYRLSRRHNKPFVKVNCAAIPASLLESELFGYERGPFPEREPMAKRDLWSWPSTVPFCWTKSERCRWIFRPSCCEPSRARRSAGSAGPRVFPSTFAISVQPIEILSNVWQRGLSARIFITAYGSSPSTFRPCGSARMTLSRCANIFCNTSTSDIKPTVLLQTRSWLC